MEHSMLRPGVDPKRNHCDEMKMLRCESKLMAPAEAQSFLDHCDGTTWKLCSRPRSF